MGDGPLRSSRRSCVRQSRSSSVRRELARTLRASFSPEEAQRHVAPTPHAASAPSADFESPLVAASQGSPDSAPDLGSAPSPAADPDPVQGSPVLAPDPSSAAQMQDAPSGEDLA